MEYSGFPLHIKSLTDAGQIEGLAAGYGNVDSHGDVIAPGAFATSIATAKASNHWPVMLLHHDPSRPVGRWDSFAETPSGLVAKGTLALGATDGKEAMALLKAGALTGLSVGFYEAKRSYGGDGVKTITEAKLMEVSLVAMPSNPKTRISSIKSIGNVRDIEDLLKEAGVSGRKAKAAASVAWRAIYETDESATADAALAAILSKATADLQRFTKGN
jgi:HK97 family phage prohead protease